MTNNLSLLTKCCKALGGVMSWQLHRISPNTYHRDIHVSPEITAMARAGKCYRCKIGRGRWFYGVNPLQAVQDALKYQEKA